MSPRARVPGSLSEPSCFVTPSLHNTSYEPISHPPNPVGDPALRWSGIPVARHSGGPAFRWSGIPVARHSGGPAFRWPGIPVARHSGGPAFRLCGKFPATASTPDFSDTPMFRTFYQSPGRISFAHQSHLPLCLPSQHCSGQAYDECTAG